MTGDFYQPIRAAVKDPTGTYVVGFALERITCNLANAPIEIVQDYRARYHPNHNPEIDRVLVAPAGASRSRSRPRTSRPGPPRPCAYAGPPTRPRPTRCSTSSRKRSCDHREAMRVSLYASAGDFEHDRTGRGETDTETAADDVWTAPSQPGPVHLWAVLRDSRGGIDFASFTIQVTP